MVVRIFALVLALVASNAFATPKIQTWVTANGARVYFVSAPELPMIDIQVTFDAGSARDGDKSGVALMTNGMLAEGAGKWDSDAIAEQFDNVGASFGNSSQRDMSVFTLRSLTDAALLKQAIDAFATVLSTPTFPAGAFDRERNRLLVGLEQKKQSPDDISDEAFFKAIYRDHPYAAQPEGTEQSIRKLSTNDLNEFYKKYYVARNAVVAIVGAVTRSDAEIIVGKIVGQLGEGVAAPMLAAVKPLPKNETVKIDFPSSQTHLLVGQAGIRRDDPDYYPLYVGNHLLGGSGLVSIISDEIREKRGLAYSSYSYFLPMRVEGPFIMGLQTRNDKRDEALQVLRNVLKDFVEKGPAPTQLDAAKKNLTGGFALKLGSNQKIAGYIAAIGFYSLPLDYLDRYIESVDAVTPEQVRDAFRRRLDIDKMVTVMVGGAPETKAPN